MKSERAPSTRVRPYRQAARADASARTREAILDAAVALTMEKAAVSMSLADIADRAGVSVQTVLRHFGSRDGLLDAALRYGSELITAERQAPEGDVPTAVQVLFDHYEARGDAVIRLLGQEHLDDRIMLVTDNGRGGHREWVRHLVPADDPRRQREDLVDQLVIVTDVYAWKILRRDRRLPRAEAERRVRDLILAVLATPTAEERV